MKTVFTALGFSLLASTSFVACADQGDDSEDNLPGDIDNASDINGDASKADAWDAGNSPTLLSTHLIYTLSKLPKVGLLDSPVWKSRFPQVAGHIENAWADTYWPSSERSHNNRWQGDTVKSPLEKYDQAFNNNAGCALQPVLLSGPGAKAQWDKYFQCSGPAATWQMKNYQGMGNMFDGIDNNRNGIVDGAPDKDDGESPASWWGTCHAWTPASLLEPEPQKAVTVNGVTFDVADIKALTQNVYDRTDALMLGGRSESKTIVHKANESANSGDMDVNPGALHVILTNFLGKNDMALIEDRTANFEVWNQPVVGYRVTKQDAISASAANACVGATGSSWTFNTSAKSLVEVRMEVDYVTEGFAQATPMGIKNNTLTDKYHYILELGSRGKIIGGRYCSENEKDHPDFLWTPLRAIGASNPFVDITKVRDLIGRAVK
jgi:hypothetical protein